MKWDRGRYLQGSSMPRLRMHDVRVLERQDFYLAAELDLSLL